MGAVSHLGTKTKFLKWENAERAPSTAALRKYREAPEGRRPAAPHSAAPLVQLPSGVQLASHGPRWDPHPGLIGENTQSAGVELSIFCRHSIYFIILSTRTDFWKTVLLQLDRTFFGCITRCTVSPERVEVLISGTCDVTLFGDRVFAGVK